MHTMRRFIALLMVTLSTLLILAHNLIPHHHTVETISACHDSSKHTEQAISTCTNSNHTCSHAQHQHSSVTQECNHSLCTEIIQFLANYKGVGEHHHWLMTTLVYIISEPPVDNEQRSQNLSYDDWFNPLQEAILKNLPRRAPPVC